MFQQLWLPNSVNIQVRFPGHIFMGSRTPYTLAFYKLSNFSDFVENFHRFQQAFCCHVHDLKLTRTFQGACLLPVFETEHFKTYPHVSVACPLVLSRVVIFMLIIRKLIKNEYNKKLKISTISLSSLLTKVCFLVFFECLKGYEPFSKTLFQHQHCMKSEHVGSTSFRSGEVEFSRVQFDRHEIQWVHTFNFFKLCFNYRPALTDKFKNSSTNLGPFQFLKLST